VRELGLTSAGDGAGDDTFDVEGGLVEDEDVLEAKSCGGGGLCELRGGVAADGAEAGGDGVGLVGDRGAGVVLRDLAAGEGLALEVAGGDDRQRAGGEDVGEGGVELLELFAADGAGEVLLRVPGDDAEDAVALRIAVLVIGPAKNSRSSGSEIRCSYSGGVSSAKRSGKASRRNL
jgi:hypothetical protein